MQCSARYEHSDRANQKVTIYLGQNLGVVKLGTDSNLPPIFFHAFVMVAPRDAKADVYHMY